MGRIEKTYLGDGVYAEFDGNSVVLTTEDGISVTNTIYLDHMDVLPNLMDWLVDVAVPGVNVGRRR